MVIGGSGAGHALPQRFIDELATVFADEGRPRDLTTVRVVGIGDFADRGFSQLGLPGLMRRTIGSNIGNEPRLGALVEANEIESYSFPQGVLSQLMREIAAGRPGRRHPGRPRARTWTRARPAASRTPGRPRTSSRSSRSAAANGCSSTRSRSTSRSSAGTTADEDGNLTMEGEAVQGEMLAMAMAARNSGGIVIAQVRQLATRGSLRMRDVKVPGALIDHVYVDPDQWQTYITRDSPYYAGAQRRPVRPEPPLPLDVRKIIARRSLLEFPPGAICNLGFGISQLIGRVAWEEGITDQLVLTVEQGIFGGVPVAGNEGGAGFNYQAMIDQPYMFDFYDGGGLDIASLSFAEVDAEGNVNVHAFEGRVRGPGGFPNISAQTGRINFVGTLTARGLEIEIDGGVRIASEGSLGKFVPEVREISFNGRLARERGQQVRYITERAVFALEADGLVLIEVAPGHRRRARRPGPDGLPAARRRRPADDGRAPVRDRADGPGRRLRGPRRERARRRSSSAASRASSSSTRRSTSSRGTLLEELDAALATLAAASAGRRPGGRRDRARASARSRPARTSASSRPSAGPAAASGTSSSPASRAAWPGCRCRPSPRSRATRSAAGWSSRCAATSGSPRSAPGSACRRCAWRSRRAPAARSGCRASSGRRGPAS